MAEETKEKDKEVKNEVTDGENRAGDEATAVREQLTLAVGKYRIAVLASAPDVPEDLVKGETIEEIDSSLERARGMVAKIRKQVEAEAAGRKVPAGAPPRSRPDLSSLSPGEKIAHALSRR